MADFLMILCLTIGGIIAVLWLLNVIERRDTALKLLRKAEQEAASQRAARLEQLRIQEAEAQHKAMQEAIALRHALEQDRIAIRLEADRRDSRRFEPKGAAGCWSPPLKESQADKDKERTEKFGGCTCGGVGCYNCEH